MKGVERHRSWNGKNAIDDGLRDIENLDMKNNVGEDIWVCALWGNGSHQI